jgi:hypothetical protein
MSEEQLPNRIDESSLLSFPISLNRLLLMEVTQVGFFFASVEVAGVYAHLDWKGGWSVYSTERE